MLEDTLSKNFRKDLEKVSQTLESLVLRMAVVGEFSKGKSTLLNAIIGEEIQPVRAIACSANINILKYGEEQRVVVKYKDGSQEEIPLEEYKAKAIMPIEVAIGNHTEALTNSTIEEIIYEHPGLELFKNGIELIDSPGLNQHPDVERLTQKLIKDVDAVIFVSSCLQPLTQNERQLLKELKTQLNKLSGKNLEEPAQNLFIVVNFIDLIRTAEDRQHISLLFQELAKGQNPIITNENRIHFISAQRAIEAIATNTENEYLKSFRDFLKEINNFLNARGYLRIQQPCNRFKQIIQDYLKELEKNELSISENVKKIEDEINRISDKIGHTENCQKEILAESEQLITSVAQEVIEIWKDWSIEVKLRSLMKKESISWSSKYNPVFKQKEIIKDYVNQLNEDLKNMLERWGNEQMTEIIQPKSEKFEESINHKLESIRIRIYGANRESKEKFDHQRYETNAKLEDNFFGIIGIRGGIVFGSISALALGLVSQPDLINVIAAGAATTILSSLGLGTIDVDKLKPRIKDKVIEEGLERFDRNKVERDIKKLIHSIFDERALNVNREIDKLILEWRGELQKKEKACLEIKEAQKSNRQLISEYRTGLELIQKEVDTLLTQL